MNLEELKAAHRGTWVSLATEVRPSKNPDGTIKPFFLKRTFVARPDDRFELTVANFADAGGAVQVPRLDLGGHMFWRGDHPVAKGAQKVDFIADETYVVTPLVPPFVDLLNRVATEGFARWELGQKQSVLGKSFAPFGLVKGQHFKE